MPEQPRPARSLELPEGLQVAYFVDLHLDTVEGTGPHPHCEGTWTYRSEGKPRPMFVLAAVKRRRRGRRWFTVLPITTKGRDENGEVLPNMMSIGDCIENGKASFLRLEPKCIPENMLHRTESRSPICKPCDELGFRNVITLVRDWARKKDHCQGLRRLAGAATLALLGVGAVGVIAYDWRRRGRPPRKDSILGHVVAILQPEQ